MELMRTYLSVFVLVTVFSLGSAWSEEIQVDPTAGLSETIGAVVRVRTAGGGEFQGLLLSVESDRIELKDHEGLILQIARTDVATVLFIDPAAGRETYYQDAAANKLILMPVGFGMEPGEFHIAAQEIAIVSSSYGFSEHFSVWGALSVPGALINARWSTPVAESVGLSAGSFFGAVFFEWGMIVGIPYVVASFGTLNQNLTVGLGVPVYADLAYDVPISEDEERASRLVTTGGILAVGGKIVLSQTASLVTENWLLVLTDYWEDSWRPPGVFLMPSVAFRIGGSRFSWDVGIMMGMMYTRPWEENWDELVAGADFRRVYDGYRFRWITEAPIPIPILNFTYRIQ